LIDHKNKPMCKQPRISKEKIIAALIAKRGLVYLAAEMAGCSVATVYNYINKYPEVAEAANHQNGMMGDFAEGKLFEAIKNGDAWAIAFYLKTKHKKRGYVEKIENEITGSNGGPIKTRIIIGPDEDGDNSNDTTGD